MHENPETDISASLQDYLEAILHLEAANRVARAKDIADRLEVTRASVSGALKTLAERGLINYKPYSYVTLSDEGRGIAREIVRRHDALLEFFRDILQMDEEHAEQVACKVEHAMDTEAADRLVGFLEAMARCPRTDQVWRDHLARVCDRGKDHTKCAACLAGLEPPLK